MPSVPGGAERPKLGKPMPRRRPKLVVDGVTLLTGVTTEGEVNLGALGKLPPAGGSRLPSHPRPLADPVARDFVRIDEWQTGPEWRLKCLPPKHIIAPCISLRKFVRHSRDTGGVAGRCGLRA